MRNYLHRRSLALVIAGAMVTVAPLFGARLRGADAGLTIGVGVLGMLIGLAIRVVTQPAAIADAGTRHAEPPDSASRSAISASAGGRRFARVALLIGGAVALAGGGAFVGATVLRPRAVVAVDAPPPGQEGRCPAGYRLIGWQERVGSVKDELPPDLAKPIDYKKVYDYSGALRVDGAISPAAEDLGMSKQELKRLAQAQGVDLEAIHKAGQKGRTYEQIAQSGRERGVIGFMPLAEREKAWSSAALCQEE